MVKIRLARVGRTHLPFYRVVVADSRRARDGKFIEILGQYQPMNPDEKKYNVKSDRALYWLHNGAQPTETVRSIFRHLGIMKDYHEAKAAAKKELKEKSAK